MCIYSPTTLLQEWAQLGGEIVDTNLALLAAERDAFELLRSEVDLFNVVANQPLKMPSGEYNVWTATAKCQDIRRTRRDSRIWKPCCGDEFCEATSQG